MAPTASEAGQLALSGHTSVRPGKAQHHRRKAARRSLAELRDAALSITVKIRVEFGVRPDPDERPGLAGQNCTIVATDVVSFGASERTDADRQAIRAATASMTEATFRAIWPECGWQDCGDGMIVVAPPQTPTGAIIASLLNVLPPALQQYNAAQGAGAQVQLRVAVHVGPVVADATGFSGDAIIGAARMLEAATFKEAVSGRAPAMGLIVSEFVFDAAVRNGGLLGRGIWTQLVATVKEREFTAWYHLVGASPLTGNGARARLSGRPAALLRSPFQSRQQAG